MAKQDAADVCIGDGMKRHIIIRKYICVCRARGRRAVYLDSPLGLGRRCHLVYHTAQCITTNNVAKVSEATGWNSRGIEWNKAAPSISSATTEATLKDDMLPCSGQIQHIKMKFVSMKTSRITNKTALSNRKNHH